MIDSKTELHQSCTIKQFAGFYKMFAVFLSKHCLLLRLKEANMSTTATPSETPSSGSTSARARLMPVGIGTGNAWHCHLTILSSFCHQAFETEWYFFRSTLGFDHFLWRIFSEENDLFLDLRLAQNYMARNLTE